MRGTIADLRAGGCMTASAARLCGEVYLLSQPLCCRPEAVDVHYQDALGTARVERVPFLLAPIRPPV